jgi:hypothetical protein
VIAWTNAPARAQTVAVAEPVIFDVMGIDTLEDTLVLGAAVLIGQTVLAQLDLLADDANRRRVPNPAHADQPPSKVQ